MIIGFISASLLSVFLFAYYYTLVMKKEYKLKEKIREFYHDREALLTKLELYGDMKSEFKTISNQSLLDSQKDFKYLLSPFENSLSRFNAEIKEYYLNESKERFSLSHQIATLTKQNMSLSDEANRLTNALRNDNQFQGSWGEFILESILQKSGLRQGHEYDIQKSFVQNSKTLRPDAVINLPSNKHIIVDSKVSLLDYESFSDTKEKEALKKHIDSLKNHIKNLSSKNYHKIAELDTIELVLLFVPIESALNLALANDFELFDMAYSKNIILVSPTTLITVLKTVEYSWKAEYQNKNAKDIAKKAASLYDKFKSFLTDLEQVEHSLDKAKNSYESAYKKLSTGNANLLKQTKELKELENIFQS